MFQYEFDEIVRNTIKEEFPRCNIVENICMNRLVIDFPYIPFSFAVNYSVLDGIKRHADSLYDEIDDAEKYKKVLEIKNILHEGLFEQIKRAAYENLLQRK